ncbi:MAG: hypothetical protein GXP53_03345 [Deltaproteobacteria bacterium]|nr:hypothetical protein [Deltaproteobacteria bacterium]
MKFTRNETGENRYCGYHGAYPPVCTGWTDSSYSRLKAEKSLADTRQF